MTTKLSAKRLPHSIFIILINACLFSCNKGDDSIPPGFQIEPGFTLTLVASEPLIKDPVDVEFNEDGEAMVLEMPGYPLEDEQSRLVVLRDNDHDGIYDERILFVDSLQLATSILPYKDGALVAAAPFLLYVIDRDGNNQADVVDTLMGGLARENLQHNYNGLTYGIDNWIYAANGGNSGKPYWWGDTTSRMDLRDQDFRFNLDEHVMEPIGKSAGGFGLGMNEWGHLYQTHNLHHIYHLVFPDRYRKGMLMEPDHTRSNISDHEENGLARIYPIGEQESRVNHPEQSGYFSGSCGITVYSGEALGPEYEQTVWVADVVLNLIHVDKIKTNGSSFSGSRMLEKRDFLASIDRSFRPVNITTGPDGSLYVVDMYRQVIEHPEWIPDEIEKKVDLNAGKDKGRIYRIGKRNSKSVSFDSNDFKTVEGILIALKNSNPWIRTTAHRLLVDQPLTEGQLQSLSKLLEADAEWTRVHALWILEAKNKLSVDQLTLRLSDSVSGIRENALIIAEKHFDKSESLIKKCVALCSDEDQRVRMQAALTISTLGKDMFDLHKDDILNALIASASMPSDEWNINAITIASRDGATELFIKLAAVEENETILKLLSSLAMVCGENNTDSRDVLEALKSTTLNENDKEEIIRHLTKGIHTNRDGNSLVPSIRALEHSAGIGVLAALASLRKKVNLPASEAFLKYSKAALNKVLDESINDSIRFQQLLLTEFLPYEKKADVLFRCLNNTEPLRIQKEALKQLSAYEDPRIGARLVAQWKDLGPEARRLASDLLIYKKVHHDALLTGLEKGTINVGEMNFDLERRRMLLWWTDDENTKRRAEAFFSDAGVMTRQKAIDKMSSALTLKGSSKQGAKIFQSMCSQCHIYGSQGEDVAPILTEINRKSKEILLHDILDPNAAVDTRYINHRLETKEGEVHMGIVETENDQFITIKKTGGSRATINKSDIKNFTSLGTSLMMEGLEGNMTQQDMADLLTFLQKGQSE